MKDYFARYVDVRGRGGKIHLKVKLADGRTIGIFNGPYSSFAKIWEDKCLTENLDTKCTVKLTNMLV